MCTGFDQSNCRCLSVLLLLSFVYKASVCMMMNMWCLYLCHVYALWLFMSGYTADELSTHHCGLPFGSIMSLVLIIQHYPSSKLTITHILIKLVITS